MLYLKEKLPSFIVEESLNSVKEVILYEKGRGELKRNISYQDYEQMLQQFRAILEQKMEDSLVSLIVYGSVARGKAHKDSDIDLLIIQKNAPEVYYQRLKPVMEAEKELRKSQAFETVRQEGLMPYLSYLILSPEEAQQNRYLFLDMIEDSVILLDKEDFFNLRLKELRQRLELLGARKVILGDDSWYWDLKPDLVAGEVFEL